MVDSIMIDDLIQVIRELGIHNGARDELMHNENYTAGIRYAVIDIEDALRIRYGEELGIYAEYNEAYWNERRRMRKEFEENE